MNFHVRTFVAACLLISPLAAQEVNTNSLSENGWFSDDTRADGTGAFFAGTNLVSDTLTDDPEASTSGLASHDADITGQIIFGDAPGAEPIGTFGGAVQLTIGPSGSGKSQISHRKDDLTGHGPGSAFGPGFTAEYSWMGDGTVSVTTSLKFGIKTTDYGSTGVSSRTGENVWDKVLIYEPGNLNGGTSDGLWHAETVDFTTGKWWFFDRTVGASIIGTPMTLSDMSTSPLIFSGAKTVADVYALITAPGAIITSVQFGVGSGNSGANVYVNQLETNAYRSGMTTTFGAPSPFDQDVTPEVIFGSGNTNGAFTVNRQNGIELALRAKQRFPAANIFNSNGDGTYTYNTGSGSSSFPNPEWAFEWSANSNFDSSSGFMLDDLTYEIGMDFDPSASTNFLSFDQIIPGAVLPYTTVPPATVFWDHAIGDNSTANGGGTSVFDGPTYVALLAANNVAQNSWRTTFFNQPPFAFDPNVPGRYDFYVAAFNGGVEAARVEMTVIVVNGTSMTLEANPCQADYDPGTAGLQIALDLWLRNPDDVTVTGYQSFLDFDAGEMTYEGALSSYSAAPFDAHFQDTLLAEVSSGKLQLDGNAFLLSGTSTDALLATLVFTVTECDTNSVSFDLTQPFDTEFSNLGVPITPALLDSPSILADDTAPVQVPNSNVTQPADAGSCTQAVVTFASPAITDNCDPSPVIVCSPASGSVFPVGTTTVTCTATDACGNESVTTFDVTVTATNAVDVVVELVGSMPATRCIRFVPDSCSSIADVPLVFTGGPNATATATIEIPCGTWTTLCAKDQQHTKWANTTLTIVGAKYVASTTLSLDGGDTDNDGDVDINDVTLFLAQFGNPAAAGGCPWDGSTRDADFDNDTTVGTPDYAFLVANWLTTSSCGCTLASTGTPRDRDLPRWKYVVDGASAVADIDQNGRVDYRDVEIFETMHGLSGELSARMRTSSGR